MFKAIICDFSRVLLFPKDETYEGSLNQLHRELSTEPGYNILDHFYLNQPILEYFKQLKKQLPLYVFTSETIQEDPKIIEQIHPIFNSIFSAKSIGVQKNIAQAYITLASMINLPVDQIVFIDDTPTNIYAAQEAGMQTIRYENNDYLLEDLGKLTGIKPE